MKAKHKDIIMLALPRWDGQFSSTAFSLAKEMARDTRVFYVDNPYTLKDLLTDWRSTQIQSRMGALLLREQIKEDFLIAMIYVCISKNTHDKLLEC